ncbi:protease [Candidatus Saccharibacteria bacterium RIFCSPHIGHO2_01_FULL_45_15]|nr:MAG: protease [Candidatus Saccharibacteria bacterium RIFCSPHIGHO2_01_FULL_45_15]OGL27598.1 MAG: protease [Candidatus Saccharibacteria bacterium RIFCSPHIGHO2_02_FULL_46_12]OGL31618.1 MAG: protease [Candidatus Saccharibacteria bacterium RIFCSPHIGHO2_12_FULL_44_22]
MYGAIAANKRNTLLIMAVFIAIIAAIGYVVSLYFGNTSISLYVIAGAAVYALIQYYAATKLALSMTGAKEIEKRDNPRLYRIVENLSITMGMPMPKVYVIEDQAPNAFATGRDPKHAVVAATTGIMEIMNDTELEAVMAHEMGHVQNYDIRVSMMAFGLVSAIGVLSDLVMHMLFFGNNDNRNIPPYFYIIAIVMVILAPIMAAIIQTAISRQREYLADATGAMTTRHPEGLASALEKLQQYGRPMKNQSTSTAHLFFSNPLKKGFLSGLFSTHPPLEDRIARLRKNADKF